MAKNPNKQSTSDRNLVRITELLKDRADAGRRIKDLEARLEDLKSTNAMLQQSEVTTPSQKEENTRVYREFDRLKKQEDDLALTVRGMFSEQISRGEHAGLSLVQVIQRYIGKGQEQHQLGWARGYDAGKLEGKGGGAQ